MTFEPASPLDTESEIQVTSKSVTTEPDRLVGTTLMDDVTAQDEESDIELDTSEGTPLINGVTSTNSNKESVVK